MTVRLQVRQLEYQEIRLCTSSDQIELRLLIQRVGKGLTP